MSRDAQPSIAFSIASARASSTRKSAGPPMPKEVRDASPSSSLTPGCSRSQARLDFVLQLILAAPPPAWCGLYPPRTAISSSRPAGAPRGGHGGGPVSPLIFYFSGPSSAHLLFYSSALSRTQSSPTI